MSIYYETTTLSDVIHIIQHVIKLLDMLFSEQEIWLTKGIRFNIFCRTTLYFPCFTWEGHGKTFRLICCSAVIHYKWGCDLDRNFHVEAIFIFIYFKNIRILWFEVTGIKSWEIFLLPDELKCHISIFKMCRWCWVYDGSRIRSTFVTIFCHYKVVQLFKDASSCWLLRNFHQLTFPDNG